MKIWQIWSHASREFHRRLSPPCRDNLFKPEHDESAPSAFYDVLNLTCKVIWGKISSWFRGPQNSSDNELDDGKNLSARLHAFSLTRWKLFCWWEEKKKSHKRVSIREWKWNFCAMNLNSSAWSDCVASWEATVEPLRATRGPRNPETPFDDWVSSIALNSLSTFVINPLNVKSNYENHDACFTWICQAPSKMEANSQRFDTSRRSHVAHKPVCPINVKVGINYANFTRFALLKRCFIDASNHQ